MAFVMTDAQRMTLDEQRYEQMSNYMPCADQLTVEQNRYVFMVVQGMSTAAACAAVGMTRTQANHPAVKEAVSWFMAHHANQVVVTRDKATAMLFEAHSHAVSATEEILAVKELGKLHNLYESDKAMQRAGPPGQVNLQVNVGSPEGVDMKNATDAQLLEMCATPLELAPIEVTPPAHEAGEAELKQDADTDSQLPLPL
jgi:hypothetical protein